MRLAYEIVKMYHGEKAAHAAQEEFTRVFSKGNMPTEIPELGISEHAIVLIDLVTRAGFAASKSEARRLIEQGGVRINEVKKTDPAEIIAIDNGMVVQSGPRKFVKIIRK